MDDPAATAPCPWPDLLERAMRLAARAHDGQLRKGSHPPLPYLAHPAAVALLLTRLGFPDEVVAAGLLHDVVEDTEVGLEAIAAEVGAEAADRVAANTERKRDESDAPRPWADRKREALDRLAAAPVEARAIALADKLHNLLSIEHDLARGLDVWSSFKADRSRVLAFNREAFDRWGQGEPRLAPLVEAGRAALSRLQVAAGPGPAPARPVDD